MFRRHIVRLDVYVSTDYEYHGVTWVEEKTMAFAIEREAQMSEAVAGHFKNSVREVRVGNCILDVAAYDKEQGLFSVIECKLGNDVTTIGHAFGQISVYHAEISARDQDFLDAYTDRVHLRWGRLMEATDWNRRIRVSFYVALTDEACIHVELIRSLKERMPTVGIVRVKANGKCRDHLHSEGKDDSGLAQAIPVVIDILRERPRQPD